MVHMIDDDADMSLYIIVNLLFIGSCTSTLIWRVCGGGDGDSDPGRRLHGPKRK